MYPRGHASKQLREALAVGLITWNVVDQGPPKVRDDTGIEPVFLFLGSCSGAKTGPRFREAAVPWPVSMRHR
jgi:hypothetical protein